MSWKVRDTSKENPTPREFDTEEDAKECRSDMISLGATPENIEIIPPDEGKEAAADGGTETLEPDVIEHSGDATPDDPESSTNTGEEDVEHALDNIDELDVDVDMDRVRDRVEDAEALDQLGESLQDDPLEILPSHMKDPIQGTPAVNKRGYAMIAERYGIGVSADIEQYPWENEEGRCVARATATTEDGREYSGWATACAGDDDMEDQIIELAETRALKRAVSWASGVGIVSYQELAGELE